MKTANDCEILTLALSNDMKIDGDGWLKLVDYGEHPHRLGMQIIDRESCERMAKQFSSLYQRLARRFHGIPIYIGHPDDPELRGQVGHSDTRAYGWVKSLSARDDGLWIYPKWSRAGLELLENAHFKFLSPRWEMVNTEGNRFSPVQLISIGLTNYPNLEVEAIANEEKGKSFFEENIFVDDASLPMPLEINSGSDGSLIALAANDAPFDQGILFRRGISIHLCQRSSFSKKMQEQQLLALVRERMNLANESFSTAWKNVKRANPILFENSTFSGLEK